MENEVLNESNPNENKTENQDDNSIENISEQNAIKEDDPYSIKKRLGMQSKRHQRELRELHEKIANLQQQLQGQNTNPTMDLKQFSIDPNDPVENQIHRAVSMALLAKDEQEKKAKAAEKIAYLQQQYRTFHENLDKAGEKYDDFDEVVRAPDAPFTPEMEQYAMTLPNAADVLYKLGKNRDELRRISNLHPLDQAKELARLSQALIMGDSGKSSSTPKTLDQIKAKPIPANKGTSVSSIRQQMKAGAWK